MHVVLVKILLAQHLSQFSSAVRSKVKKEYHIAFFDSGIRLGYTTRDQRLNKFIGNSLLVTLLEGSCKIIGQGTGVVYQRIVGYFYPFPAFVSVHGVIATH